MTLSPRDEIILASTSKTRQKMFNDAGLFVVTHGSNVDENKIKDNAKGYGMDAAATAKALAFAKAEAVSKRFRGSYVIGADQMLSCGALWLSKAASLDSAKEQLLFLCGKPHILSSAVSVVRDGVSVFEHVDEAHMSMRKFSNDFIDQYLRAIGDDVLGSVGCYQLEGQGVQLFDKIEGDYFTILGLPLLPLLAFLRKIGMMNA